MITVQIQWASHLVFLVQSIISISQTYSTNKILVVKSTFPTNGKHKVMQSEGLFFLNTIFHANRSTDDLIHICHFQHYFNPQGGWHKARVDTKALWSGFTKMARKILQTHWKYKYKIKSNSSKQDLGLGRNINGTKQCTNEHVVSTPWDKDVPPGSAGRIRCSRTHPHQTPGSAHNHRFANTYLPGVIKNHLKEKIHNQNFSTTLNVFIRWSVWRLCLKEFREAFRVLVWRNALPHSNREESSISQNQTGNKRNHDNRF